MEETRLAILGIFVRDLSRSEAVNALLHDYGAYVVGRLGVPCRERGVSVISVIVDAPNEIISALSGKLGRIPNVQAKAMYTKS